MDPMDLNAGSHVSSSLILTHVPRHHARPEWMLNLEALGPSTLVRVPPEPSKGPKRCSIRYELSVTLFYDCVVTGLEKILSLHLFPRL